MIPEYIEIKTADGQQVAVLSPEADGLKDAEIDIELNGQCTLSFLLPIQILDNLIEILTINGVIPTIELPNYNKLAYLSDQYLLYVGGREFTILNPGAIEIQRDGQKKLVKITAHESWIRLGKKYAENGISNDPQNPTVPPLTISILSGGDPYPGCDAGSAKSALSYLLEGTGWSVDIVDVDGVHDLETEKESILANIQKVQEIWGGILIWDSINYKLSLRDESWQNYTGYQIRYAKNLKDINRTDDYDIITRLYPFGEDNLSIASVNNGVPYIENFSYTSSIAVGVWENQDIADPQELLNKATKYLETICRPRHNYQVKHVDLRILSGYQHETFNIGDMVDIIDEDLGINVRARIIRYKYSVFHPWQCDLEVGDPIENGADLLEQAQEVTKYIRNIRNSKGQITAYKLVDESIIKQKIAGAAVDATKLDTKTVILLGDTWTDNSPSPGYISWNQHKLYYAGREYVILAGNTNLKYIYWDGISNTYSASATEPDLTDGQFYIAVNNGGLHDLVWNAPVARKFIGSLFIADAAIKSAHIDNAQILDAHIANINANKINVTDLTALTSGDGYSKMVGTGFKVYDPSGSLMGHLGSFETPSDQTATFSRSSVAYKSDGAQVAANVPRFEAGKFGKAWFGEEGTTNALSYAFTSDANLLQYFTDTHSGSSVTIDSAQTPPVSGQKVVKHYAGVNDSFIWANDANGVGYGTASTAKLAVTGGSYVTFSIWAKGQNGGEQIEIYIFDYASDTGDSRVRKAQTFIITNTWQRYIVTVQTASDAVRAWARVDNNLAGQTVYWCTPQLENKAYVTSFTPATRSPETLTIPTAGVLNSQEGTVEMRLYVNPAHRDPSSVRRFFGHLPGPGNSNRITMQHNNGPHWLFSIGNANGDTHSLSIADSDVADGWRLFTMKWGVSEFAVYVDGVKKAFLLNPTYLPSAVGQNINISGNTNSLIDDLRISSRARTDAEISAAYNSNQPLPVDEDTTWKSSFDGHLYNEVPIRKYGLMLKRGTIKLEAPTPDEGIQIYDAQGNLRTHIGQYAAGKYGAKVVNGEIYSTSINSGMPGDVNRIELSAGFMPLTVYYNNKRALNMYAVEDGGYLRIFNPTRNTPVGWLFGFDDIRGCGIGLEGSSGTGGMPVHIGGSSITLEGEHIDITDNDDYAYVTIDGELMVHGPLYVTGQPKNAIEHTSQGYVALAAVEAPEVLYIDRGIAELINGECRVDLDPLFLECIMPNSEETPWNIFLTPKGPFTLYEAEIRDTYFVVRSHDPNANGKFSWILVAVRKGMTGIRLQKVWDDDEVLTSNWEDELGVVIDEEPESNMG